MKRAAVFIAVLPAVLLVVPAPARAQDNSGPGVLLVQFFLRASLRDEMVACSDHDFMSDREALNFARVIGPELGFGTGSFEYDQQTYADCVNLFPDHGLTQPGRRPHERTFRFSAGPVLAAAKKAFHFDVIDIEVCFPELPRTVSPPPDQTFASGDCDHPSQDMYSWIGGTAGFMPTPIQISFRATPASLLRGLIGEVVFWAFVVGFMWLISKWQRASRWRFFMRLRGFIAWPLDVLLILILSFVALSIAPYASGWIPSLQLYLHIGVVGELFLVAVPSVALAIFMIAGPIRGVRTVRAGATFAGAAPIPPPVSGIPTLGIPEWKPPT